MVDHRRATLAALDRRADVLTDRLERLATAEHAGAAHELVAVCKALAAIDAAIADLLAALPAPAEPTAKAARRELVPGYFTVIGTWRHVDEDPNSILVDVESATYLRPDGTLNDLAESAPYWIGATMRYAYAPTDSPDLITVSTRVAELMYDADAGMWVDNMYNPYGDYWMRLSRQQ